MTYREAIYLVLDEIKSLSDDALFTEDHVMFLLDKYRAFLLKQRYSDIKKQIPESNYQTICLDLIEVPAISGEPCEGGSYLRSRKKIPFLMKIGNPIVYPVDYYQGEITYVSRERMRHVGYNKYLKNIIYASIGPDNYLYFTEKRGYPEPKFKWKSRYWTFLLKLTPDRPSWTIQASFSTNQGPFHWRNRFLRIEELKRIQTIPDSYELCGDFKEQWRQVGNAVPSNMAYVIAAAIKEAYFNGR